jgi:putative transposase
MTREQTSAASTPRVNRSQASGLPLSTRFLLTRVSNGSAPFVMIGSPRLEGVQTRAPSEFCRRMFREVTEYSGTLARIMAGQGTEAVIPPMSRGLMPPSYDPVAYRLRNIIERAFCKLKDWRGVATRYDKTARISPGICLAVAVTSWIKTP